MPVTINGDGIVTAEGTSTTQGRLRLGEDTDNGTNYVELQAPASVASNVTFTLPSADGTNGQVLQTNGSGALSFATPSTGGLTLITTLTPANLATTASVTSVSSYKSIMVVTSGFTLSTTGGLNFAVSSNNGSTYSDNVTFTNTNGSTPSGFVQVFRTNESSANKGGFVVNGTSPGGVNITSVTGVINAVRIAITTAATFTGTGTIAIYGMN